jgi:hypothetical protein
MGLLFRPSVGLYHDFIQGRKLPYPVYLIAGPYADGYCLGVYDAIVAVPFKAVLFDMEDPDKLFFSPHAFDCLSLYAQASPHLQVAQAETRAIKPYQSFMLRDLDPVKQVSYQEDLDRLLSF